MRVKRAKLYKRTIHFYKTHFGFYEPFQVLLDGPFIAALYNHQIDFSEAISRVLMGPCQFFVTPCTMNELAELKLSDVYEFAKTKLKRRVCGHDTHRSGRDCVLDLIGDRNKFRFVVGTNDPTMTCVGEENLVSVPGVPVVSLQRTVMILLSISQASLDFANKVEETKMMVKDHEKGALEEAPKAQIKKKKKKKGANPLSCLKKKDTKSEGTKSKSEKKRKHKSRKKQPEATCAEPN